MIEKIANKCQLFFCWIVPNSWKTKILDFLFFQFGIDPLMYSLNKIGILKYQNDRLSGEAFLIKHVLSSFIVKGDFTIMFDIGANVGNYTANFLEAYPNSFVYSFEPNYSSFLELRKRFVDNSRVVIENFALGSSQKESKLFSYTNDPHNEHASLFPEVIKSVHGIHHINDQKVMILTLDQYCETNKVGKIHFLKIDTEGNEFDVLIGASKMIASNSIDLIQFEFNEMNVFSRVFFKDFFSILSDKYSIYRIDSERLIPLTEYNSIMEIFKYQNILAISRQLNKDV